MPAITEYLVAIQIIGFFRGLRCSAGYRRHYAERVTIIDLGRAFFCVTNIFVVHIDVYEMPQLSFVIVEMLLQIRVLIGQRVKRSFYVTGLDRHRIGASGVISKRDGDQNIHSHWGLLPNSCLSLRKFDCRVETGKSKALERVGRDEAWMCSTYPRRPIFLPVQNACNPAW